MGGGFERGRDCEQVCVSGCEEWLLKFAKQNKITDNSVWLIGYFKVQKLHDHTLFYHTLNKTRVRLKDV